MFELLLAGTEELRPGAQNWLARLGPARRERARSYKNEGDFLRCLAGGLLMQKALGTDDVAIEENGKPYLPDGPHFSLSHSGSWAVLAVSDAPLGVDVEKAGGRNWRRLMGRLHPREIEALRLCAEPEALFYRIWTRKESYVKMLGRGLSMDFRAFCVYDETGEARIHAAPPVFFHEYADLPGYALTVCSEASERAAVRRVTFI